MSTPHRVDVHVPPEDDVFDADARRLLERDNAPRLLSSLAARVD